MSLEEIDREINGHDRIYDLTAIDGGGSLTPAELVAVSSYGLPVTAGLDAIDAEDSTPIRIVSLNELPKTGGGAAYTMDITSHTVDKTIREVMPEQITECSLISNGDSGTCVGEAITANIAEVIHSKSTAPADVIEEAKKLTGCSTEKCAVATVLKNTKHVSAIIARYFKVDGPVDTTLLSNINIDDIMEQYAMKYRDFFPYSFNMVDYAQNSFVNGEVVHSPDTLATIQWEWLRDGTDDLPEAYAGRKYKTCGCIINSDVYDGPGKHWMALFADWRTTPATIEFFNSAGNSPVPEFCNWMVKTKIAMESAGLTAECINVTSIRHQHTRSECGVYSLFYVWARLNGVPVSYFNNTPIPDNVMFEFRQHLFSDSKYVSGGKFNFAAFKAGAKIDWEPGHNS